MLTLLMVPAIMVCATGGTIGMIKVIKKIAPGRFPNDSTRQEVGSAK